MNRKQYKFSFTAASLQVPMMIRLAQKLIKEDITPGQLEPADLRKERANTGIRELREFRDRLETLSRDELALLADGPFDEQKYISLVAFARQYRFFYDFMVEVIAEKVSVFDFTLTDMDYNVFVNRKAVEHPKIENLTTNTLNKVKQQIFKVLEQGGILNNVRDRQIQVPLLSESFIQLLSDTNPMDLKLLLN